MRDSDTTINDTKSSSASRAMLIAVYALAFAIPMFTRIYLNAPISILAVAFLILPIVALGYASRKYATEMPWIKYLSATLNAVGGALVLIGILITPISAYQSWFDTFRYGAPEGGVSNLFVIITGYFSAVLSPLMLSMGVLWPIFVLVFTMLYLLAIIIQSQVYLLVVLGFLVIPSAYLALRSVSRIRREGALTFSLGLIGASFILAMAVPKFENPPGNSFVNDRLYPKLRKQVVASVPRFPLLFSVPGYGITFDEKQLGGIPTLLPNPIFTVTGNPLDQIYLRTRIFDTYDGSSWAMSPYFADRSTDALRSQFFGQPGEVRAGDLRVELTAKTFGFIPYTIDTDMIIFDSGFPRISEGSIDTGFRLQTPMRREDVVYLRRSENSLTATNPLTTAEQRLYLQIPDDLPPELRVIADGLSPGDSDSEQILTNIEDFLAQNYTYNLEIEEMIPDEVITSSNDFVYSFLFSESGGYCVQFATSFIILARLNEIPARYATGYLAYIPREESTSDVSGLSAHAWPEVWVEGKGWVNWEATPAANIANYSGFGDSLSYNFDVDMNDATSRQLETLIGANFSDPNVRSSGNGRWWRISLIAIAALAAVSGVTIGVVYIMRGVRYFVRDETGKFYHRAKRLSRSLDKRGIPLPERVGWIAWFDQVDGHVEDTGLNRPMRNLVMRLTYTDDNVTQEHLNEIAIYSRYIRKQIKQSNGSGNGHKSASPGS